MESQLEFELSEQLQLFVPKPFAGLDERFAIRLSQERYGAKVFYRSRWCPQGREGVFIGIIYADEGLGGNQVFAVTGLPVWSGDVVIENSAGAYSVISHRNFHEFRWLGQTRYQCIRCHGWIEPEDFAHTSYAQLDPEGWGGNEWPEHVFDCLDYAA